jgi:hypothetical protein
MKTVTLSQLERYFDRRIIDNNSGCWLWNGPKNRSGHAEVRIDYEHYLLSRVSASVYLGLDLNDKINQANHRSDKCNNAECWNPEHLYIGTQQENVQDRVATNTTNKGSRYKTHCPKGHEYTDKDSYTNPKTNKRYCRVCRRKKRVSILRP